MFGSPGLVHVQVCKKQGSLGDTVWCSSRCSSAFVLSPLLFIIVLEALSREFRKGLQWDDLMNSAGSMSMLYAGSGCKLAAVIRCKRGWGQFRQLLYLLTDHDLLLVNRGRVYLTCVRSVMLHVEETWAMTAATLNRLPRNDHAMIRWSCNVKARDEVSSDLLLKLGIQSLDASL